MEESLGNSDKYLVTKKHPTQAGQQHFLDNDTQQVITKIQHSCPTGTRLHIQVNWDEQQHMTEWTGKNSEM